MPTSLAILIAALAIGIAKGGLGGAVVGLVVPLLSTVMPVGQAVGLTLPLLLLGDMLALRAYWREWEWRYLRMLLPAATVGVLIGVLLLTNLSDLALRRILGGFTLMLVLYKLGSDEIAQMNYTPHRWIGVLAGGGAGLASAMANAGGPLLTVYLLLEKRPAIPFLGTTTLFFALVNVIKLPFFLSTNVIDISALLNILWVLPVIPLGVWLGKKALTSLDQQVFERVMLALLTYSGIALLVR